MNLMASKVRAVVCAALFAFGLAGCDESLTPDTTTHGAALSEGEPNLVAEGSSDPSVTACLVPSVDCACPPDACWKNHGEYVSCVAHAVQDLREAGYISASEGGAIVSAAGRSSIGKNGSSCGRYGGWVVGGAEVQ